MKQFIRIIDDDYYGAAIAIIAAESLEEAKFIMTHVHSKEEYVQRYIDFKDPAKHPEQYKTEAGLKQAIESFESWRKLRYAQDAADEYSRCASHIEDTNIEVNVKLPGVIWERNN